ncbi:hypothetical protein MTO96_047280 [Rhipicephalus appendiculatus]
MNTAPSGASSRASSPTHRPPHKHRSPSSDAIGPHEPEVVRETACFLEAFKQRVMTRFTRLEERVAAIESHLTVLDTRVAALETRQSATEGIFAHLSLPAPLIRPLPGLRSVYLPLIMARHHSHLNLWQWICRGFRGKRSTLQLHLQNMPSALLPLS